MLKKGRKEPGRLQEEEPKSEIRKISSTATAGTNMEELKEVLATIRDKGCQAHLKTALKTEDAMCRPVHLLYSTVFQIKCLPSKGWFTKRR